MFTTTIRSFFRSFANGSNHDPLIEGWYADQYQDRGIRDRIQTEYQQLWCSEPTPATKPELFDPLAPPSGWRYDPYYEIWTQQWH